MSGQVYKRKGRFAARQWDGHWRSAMRLVDFLADEYNGGDFLGNVQIRTIDPRGAGDRGSFTGEVTDSSGFSHTIIRHLLTDVLAVAATDWVVVFGNMSDPVVVVDADFAAYWDSLTA